MVDATLIEKVVIDFPEAGPEERADLWADAVRPLFDATLIGSSPSQHTIRADAWLLDTLFLTNAVFCGQMVQRGRNHVAQDDTPTVLIEFYLKGSLRGELDGSAVGFDAGDIHLIDFTREYRAQSTPSEVRGLVISHEALGYDPAIHPPVIRVPGDNPIAGLVRTAILSIHKDLDTTKMEDAPSIARTLIALLRSVLLDNAEISSGMPGISDARHLAVRDYVRQNLRSSEISTEHICDRFGISKATLYRDFKDDGGFRRFLLDSRLDAALLTLATSEAERGAINRTADYWRFPNTSYFGREFKRKFGVGPSDVIGTKFKPASISAIDDTHSTGNIEHLLKRL